MVKTRYSCVSFSLCECWVSTNHIGLKNWKMSIFKGLWWIQFNKILVCLVLKEKSVAASKKKSRNACTFGRFSEMNMWINFFIHLLSHSNPAMHVHSENFQKWTCEFIFFIYLLSEMNMWIHCFIYLLSEMDMWINFFI